MKKNIISLTLLIVVLVAIPVIIHLDYQNSYDPQNETFPDIPKDEKWEYVKDRLFDGETSIIYKLEGPILLVLRNASKTDSLLVEKAMQNIKEILPNKEINFYNRFIGKSPKELGSFLAEKRMGEMYIDKDVFKGYKYKDIINSTIYLSFDATNEGVNGDVAGYDYYSVHKSSYVLRKEPFRFMPNNRFGGVTIIKFFIKDGILDDNYKQDIIKGHLMKSLCKIQGSRRNIEHTNSIYGFIKKGMMNTVITENDEFLLQKLYAPDFMEQFKTYLDKTYPWHYATNFFNKSKTKTYTNWTAVFLGLFFLIIGFNLSNNTYRFKYFNYLIPTTLLLIGLGNLSIIYGFMTSKSQNMDLSSLGVSYLIPILTASIIALLLFLFDKYVINKGMNFTVELGCKTISTFIVFILPLVILSTADFKNNGWDFIITVGFPVVIIAVGRGILIYLNHFSENLIKQKDVELSRLKEVNAQAEVKLLQSQINPHFLYNALNSIASLAHKNADKTEKMALSLSDLFKYTINRKGKKDSTIGDEVEMVANYLEVEQIRFDDRLNFTIDVDKSLENIKIPMFLIQPLIENAVKHGISKVENDGQISLSIQKIDVGFTILVEDNGPDFPEGVVSGHGLQTVFDLLRLTYNDKASISWKNKPNKQIKITIEN